MEGHGFTDFNDWDPPRVRSAVRWYNAQLFVNRGSQISWLRPNWALMPGDKRAADHDLDAMCADANRDHFACPFGRNAGAIAVCRHETGAGNAPYVEDWGPFDTGIKRHADRLQHRLFQPEDPGDGGILSGMTLSQAPAYPSA